MSGVTRRHHQVHHCLHLRDLPCLDELDNAQLTLPTSNTQYSYTGFFSLISKISHIWLEKHLEKHCKNYSPALQLQLLYLFKLLSTPLGLSDNPLGSIHTHPWRRLRETLATTRHCPFCRSSMWRGGSRTSRGFIQHKPAGGSGLHIQYKLHNISHGWANEFDLTHKALAKHPAWTPAAAAQSWASPLG